MQCTGYLKIDPTHLYDNDLLRDNRIGGHLEHVL